MAAYSSFTFLCFFFIIVILSLDKYLHYVEARRGRSGTDCRSQEVDFGLDSAARHGLIRVEEKANGLYALREVRLKLLNPSTHKLVRTLNRIPCGCQMQEKLFCTDIGRSGEVTWHVLVGGQAVD
ncbi:hypothetical protein IEQ34_009286 [Dendrobium chrysotoxum]|uniref:Uncharacterized protein n=1 Tax=Dendrobium chrysotoxum TaxID=161865 RepID=A0AAV7GY89_DENCH|nr:hypothetical protein IEQ34_009286 [Dendrobium chrysotoxum]